MPEVRVLTSASPDLEQKLLLIQKLARQVFEPEIPEDQYESAHITVSQLQLDNWRDRLRQPHGAIFYVDDEPSTTPEGTKPVAFFLAHPRPLTNSSSVSDISSDCYYIYLAAVHPAARSQGLFPLLLEATKQYARQAGYDVLSIGTIPSRFPRMYRNLTKEGNRWEVVEWKDGLDEHGGQIVGGKVVMKMAL